ncbi:hypothetical protein VTN49DRAFT_2583 [Thermomyces lanuginosus]|uniref:uncharacterized protein n=1 Tax=Thermomyces lanuginosus TaxID=5541 RepID=UPI0037441C35
MLIRFWLLNYAQEFPRESGEKPTIVIVPWHYFSIHEASFLGLKRVRYSLYVMTTLLYTASLVLVSHGLGFSEQGSYIMQYGIGQQVNTD